MKRAVIFLNGERPDRNVVFNAIKTTDTIICANGGSKHAVALGVVPHIIIGDRDSLSTVTLRALKKHPIEWITYPKEKDETDSELAIQFACDREFTDLILFGFVGSRLDHMLATLLLLATDFVTFHSITLIDAYQVLHILKARLELSGKKGEYLSLVPLLSDAKGVTTKGLKWRLHDDTLRLGRTRGVSNEFMGERAVVSIKEGALLIVHSKKRR